MAWLKGRAEARARLRRNLCSDARSEDFCSRLAEYAEHYPGFRYPAPDASLSSLEDPQGGRCLLAMAASEGDMMGAADHIVSAIRDGDLSTRDLVLISCALAGLGTSTMSVLGQYGEELVAAAYNGSRGSFDQKGYDVVTASGERLQVKTCTKGRRPGVIRSFAYDVITLEVDPATASVVKARRYSAGELYAAFQVKWEAKYRHINASFAAWGGRPEDRFERGWTIGSDVLFTDITHLFPPDE